jgi:hypothetical protein
MQITNIAKILLSEGLFPGKVLLNKILTRTVHKHNNVNTNVWGLELG